jgi:hypothetical protein
VNYFFDQFTASSGHWTFLRDADLTIMKDPLLDMSMRACGMAALHNVRGVVMGREYARSVYGQAIGLLNTALRDPKMCRLDSTLISVAMLGYYENLVCDSMDSVRSWKAHISGATQLLHLRGKAQFKTSVGRMLYREIRTQVLISCIWDEQEPPAFILEWESELQKQSSLSGQAIAPPDRLAVISFDFATLLSQIRGHTISPETALHEAHDPMVHEHHVVRRSMAVQRSRSARVSTRMERHCSRVQELTCRWRLEHIPYSSYHPHTHAGRSLQGERHEWRNTAGEDRELPRCTPTND